MTFIPIYTKGKLFASSFTLHQLKGTKAPGASGAMFRMHFKVEKNTILEYLATIWSISRKNNYSRNFGYSLVYIKPKDSSIATV